VQKVAEFRYRVESNAFVLNIAAYGWRNAAPHWFGYEEAAVKRLFVVLALFTFTTLPAHADLTGTSVTGSLHFDGLTENFFDPANGFVPAGFLNAAGPTVTISNTAAEFGFDDGANTDIANFTGSALVVTDDDTDNAANWVMTFTDTAFLGLNLVQTSDTFTNGGVTGVLSGDTITLDWAGTSTADGLMATTFTLNPANTPEPSSILLLGSALICLLGLSRRKLSA
jgi:hypothetical protein